METVAEEDEEEDQGKQCDDFGEGRLRQSTDIDGTGEVPLTRLHNQGSSSSEFCRDKTGSIEAGKLTRLEAALEEWKSVGEKEIRPNAAIPFELLPICSSMITFEAALETLMTEINLDTYRPTILVTAPRRKGFKGWVRSLFVKPHDLMVQLVEERLMVLALAQLPFDDGNETHNRMLQTIFRKLTNSTFDCPRFGAHWEKIGFQGNDPSTDLRGCGMLGLCHLMFLATHPLNSQISEDIFSKSLHRVQNFPFAAMSLNITKISLESLREGRLNKICNAQGAILPALNDFFVGTYLILFLTWQKNSATVKKAGYILKEVAKFAKKRPKAVFSNLEFYRENGIHDEFCDVYFSSLNVP